MTPEFPRADSSAPRASARSTAAPSSVAPSAPAGSAATSSAAPRSVSSTFVPVSPSGTGNTFTASIRSRAASRAGTARSSQSRSTPPSPSRPATSARSPLVVPAVVRHPPSDDPAGRSPAGTYSAARDPQDPGRPQPGSCPERPAPGCDGRRFEGRGPRGLVLSGCLVTAGHGCAPRNGPRTAGAGPTDQPGLAARDSLPSGVQ